MKEIKLDQLEYLIGQMKALQRDHPKAAVVYSFEENRTLITYPLPADLREFDRYVLNEKETRAKLLVAQSPLADKTINP